ncbi:MAG TPA: type II toxin-antitoxin system VapC family toxin [Pseudacidobacterium sp.]|nr:type II toxin-antitoxin system VapC family toxin [Pseudacidobacterium sp.]
MSRIFWDTNLFIYLFEDYGKHSRAVENLRRRMLERGDQLVTSSLTIGEILTKPHSVGNHLACEEYEEAIRATALVVNFDILAARNFAKLRAQNEINIRPPDAIQLACAATAGVDLFLTNDTHLHHVHVDGIHFITSVDRAPL